MDSLYLVMPAYNESEALPTVLDEWYGIVERNSANRLVVVNDGSTDATETVLRKYAENHPQLIVITKPNGGHGSAIYWGYRYALESTPPPDYIFQTDSDGQTNPSEFPQLWNRRSDYDAVFGWRNKREDGLGRIAVTKTLKTVVSNTLHANLKDANTPFRLMKRQALEDVFPLIPENHNLTNIVLSAALARSGKSLHYEPISFKQRKTGANSINLRSITHIGLAAIADFREIGKHFDSIFGK